jgi:hypothetical protein
MTLIIGFAGRQTGPSAPQVHWLRTRLRRAAELHHGACIGADALAHRIAVGFGIPVVVHPPHLQKNVEPACLSPGELITVRHPRAHFQRSYDIVDECDVLLALPHSEAVVQSRTWATVGYAMRIGKPVLLCYPDGRPEALRSVPGTSADTGDRVGRIGKRSSGDEASDFTFSPEIPSYVTSCLRQLATINSDIPVEELFRPGTLREPGTLTRPDDTAREATCPQCQMVHAGECL